MKVAVKLVNGDFNVLACRIRVKLESVFNNADGAVYLVCLAESAVCSGRKRVCQITKNGR